MQILQRDSTITFEENISIFKKITSIYLRAHLEQHISKYFTYSITKPRDVINL